MVSTLPRKGGVGARLVRFAPVGDRRSGRRIDRRRSGPTGLDEAQSRRRRGGCDRGPHVEATADDATTSIGLIAALRSDERSRSPESVFMIPGSGVQLHRNAHQSFWPVQINVDRDQQQ